MDFWDNKKEMWGSNIIESRPGYARHPLKKAFELYCEMKKEKDEDEDTEMTPEELQMDFWENMGEMWGYDIIGSKSHPLKKAFEKYCKMEKSIRQYREMLALDKTHNPKTEEKKS